MVNEDLQIERGYSLFYSMFSLGDNTLQIVWSKLFKK